jgi:hypothetical protein
MTDATEIASYEASLGLTRDKIYSALLAAYEFLHDQHPLVLEDDGRRIIPTIDQVRSDGDSSFFVRCCEGKVKVGFTFVAEGVVITSFWARNFPVVSYRLKHSLSEAAESDYMGLLGESAFGAL